MPRKPAPLAPLLLFFVLALALPAQAAPWRLHPALTTGQSINKIALSPNAETVAYSLNLAGATEYNVYSVPFQGGTPVKLSTTVESNQEATGLLFSPDSNFIYYVMQYSASPSHLYRVPASGGAPTRLTPATYPNTACEIALLPVDHTGQNVLYLADQEAPAKKCLYRAPADGSYTPVVLSQEAGELAGQVTDASVSPDGQWAVWRADASVADRFMLFSRKLDGSTGVITLCNAPNTLGAGGDFLITADSSRVIYRADNEAAGRYDLYSVPIGGGSSTRLSFDFTYSPGDVTGFKSAGTKVVFKAESLRVNIHELYAVDQAGGTPVKLCPDQQNAEGVTQFQILPDLSGVVYSAFQEDDTHAMIYKVPLTGTTPLRLNCNFSNDTHSTDFQASPNGKLIAYISSDAENNHHLFTVTSNHTNPRTTAGLVPEELNTIMAMKAVSENLVVFAACNYVLPQPTCALYAYLPKNNRLVSLDEGLDHNLMPWSFLTDSKAERIVFPLVNISMEGSAYANFLPQAGSDQPYLLLLK